MPMPAPTPARAMVARPAPRPLLALALPWRLFDRIGDEAWPCPNLCLHRFGWAFSLIGAGCQSILLLRAAGLHLTGGFLVFAPKMRQASDPLLIRLGWLSNSMPAPMRTSTPSSHQLFTPVMDSHLGIVSNRVRLAASLSTGTSAWDVETKDSACTNSVVASP